MSVVRNAKSISVQNRRTVKVEKITETELHSSKSSCVVTANAAGCTRLFLCLCLFIFMWSWKRDPFSRWTSSFCMYGKQNFNDNTCREFP